MSAASLIQIKGAIEFHFSVTDFELARKIDQLLRHNSHNIVPNATAKQDGNGHANRPTRSGNTKERILQALKEKYGTASFPLAEAAWFIESMLKHGSATTYRALKMGRAQARLTTDKKGIYHFLESAMTQPQAIKSEKPKDTMPLPKST
jgi:hypothetical protein